MADTPVEHLTKAQARAELADLAARIAAANTAYHGLDAPEIPDADYDALKGRNAAIEAALECVRNTGDLPVPLHLRNAPTKLMKELG